MAKRGSSSKMRTFSGLQDQKKRRPNRKDGSYVSPVSN